MDAGFGGTGGRAYDCSACWALAWNRALFSALFGVLVGFCSLNPETQPCEDYEQGCSVTDSAVACRMEARIHSS